MANRVLRDYTDSEKVDGLSPHAEVFFIRLFMKADDHGIHPAHPALLKSALFPLKSYISDDIITWMGECIEQELIIKYRAQEKDFIQIINFGQRLRNMRVKYPQPSDSDLPADGGEARPETKRNETNPKQETETESEKAARLSLIKRIVECLNFVTQSSYRHQSDKTTGFITARLREKFSFDDFQTVIIHKQAEWGEDVKWQKFLRPETIFGNKFEGYLQAAKREKRMHIVSKTDQLKKYITEQIKNELTTRPNN